MAATATTTTIPTIPTPLPSTTPIDSKDVNQQGTDIPTAPTAENILKRSHPEYDEKSKEELVEEEKKKIKKIHTLVTEVQHDTEAIDSKIAEARESKDVAERNGLITDIKIAAAEVKDKVVSAAQLENDVAEINAVLKEKHTTTTEDLPKSVPPTTEPVAQNTTQ